MSLGQDFLDYRDAIKQLMTAAKEHWLTKKPKTQHWEDSFNIAYNHYHEALRHGRKLPERSAIFEDEALAAHREKFALTRTKLDASLSSHSHLELASFPELEDNFLYLRDKNNGEIYRPERIHELSVSGLPKPPATEPVKPKDAAPGKPTDVKPDKPADAKPAEKRTWTQAFTEKKDALKKTAQEHRVLGGIGGVAGVGAGVVMAYDGYTRVRKGLGYDVQKESQALDAPVPQPSMAQAALGGVEIVAGTGLATVGGYTAVAAMRGKVPPTAAI